MLRQAKGVARQRIRSSIILGCTCALVLHSPSTKSLQAQTIQEDPSLSTRVTRSANGLDYTIEDGDRTGTNLFHSFTEFSVSTGGSATFANDVNILNIISRVTGATASNIDGIVAANGGANLFLLNPNGIIFGPNAQLQIGGSFIGSTAEHLQFEDKTIFSTAGLPSLTMSVPTGLQLGSTSGQISVTGTGHRLERSTVDGSLTVTSSSKLSVPLGRTLGLISNDITLSGGRLSTTSGRIELGSVQTGLVKLASTGAGFNFDYTPTHAFSDIYLSQALVDGISPGGGLIQLRGENISVVEGGAIYVQNQAPVASEGVRINASGLFTIAGRNPAMNSRSVVAADSLLGPGGSIEITAQDILLSGGIGIESISFLSPGGDVTVNAENSIVIKPDATTPDNTTGIDTLSFSPNATVGRAGNLFVTADQLSVLGGSTVASFVYGVGDSGTVDVNARLINVEGINPRRLRPSIIASGTFAIGNANDLTIKTERLSVLSGGRIDSSTSAVGNAGSVLINATEEIVVSGRVANSINPSLIGSSANILDEQLRLELNAPPIPTGDSGDLVLNTPSLSISEGAQVTVRNDGPGKGGTLWTNVESLRLSDAAITASARSGEGGNISVVASGPVLIREESLIAAEAGGTGNGGNIKIKTPFLIATDNSDVIANAVEGNGGVIEITTQGLVGIAFREQQTPNSDITASSQFGVSGAVEISSFETDPSSGTRPLPENLADYSSQITAGCSDRQRNRFILSGRGGIALNPRNYVTSDSVWADIRDLSALNASQQAPARLDVNSVASPIIEASRWTTNEQGEVILSQQTSSHSTLETATSCLSSSLL